MNKENPNNYKCEVCKTTNMVVIAKPQSQEDKKRNSVQSFVVCKKCEPVMASFYYLEDGYKELQLALKKTQEKI